MGVFCAGSKYHRPAEHTHAISGKTLQGLQLCMAAAASGAQPEKATQDAGGEPLCQDEHDEFCYVCGLGVGRYHLYEMLLFCDYFVGARGDGR